jgi:hypothetical protein
VRMIGGGLPAWLVVPWSPSLVSSFVPSSSISVLRGAKKFLVGSPACGHIRESRASQPVTTVLPVWLPCLSEAFRLRFFCSRNTVGDATCSDWSVSLISRWMSA